LSQTLATERIIAARCGIALIDAGDSGSIERRELRDFTSTVRHDVEQAGRTRELSIHRNRAVRDAAHRVFLDRLGYGSEGRHRLGGASVGSVLFRKLQGANFGLLLIVFAQSVHAARNRWLSQSEIIAWVIALWIIPYLTPIYWYRYMRPSLESEWIDDE